MMFRYLILGVIIIIMFGKQVYIIEEHGDSLMDDRGIFYRNRGPVLTADVDFLRYPFSGMPSDMKKYLKLIKEIESNPLINAWRDAGIVKKETIVLEIPDIDVDGTINRESREVLKETRRIEFYHLGENPIRA